MTRAYAWLLRMYPRGEWALFSAEMLATFKEAAREHRGRGWAVYARFALREILGLFAGAVRAWFAAWREAPALDLTKMRPPGVPRQAYAEALDEVIEAQRSVESNLAHATRHLPPRIRQSAVLLRTRPQGAGASSPAA